MLSFRFILLFMCQLENVYMLLLTVRVPKGPENYNPTRPLEFCGNPTQPDTPAWIICPNLARTHPEPGPNPTPHAPALFSSYTCYRTQQRQVCVCVCPSPWSWQPDLLFITHEQQWFTTIKQYIIYNLQEMCFIKKGSPRPNPTQLICVFIRPEPGPNLRVRSGLSGWPDPLRTLLIVSIAAAPPFTLCLSAPI